MARTSLGRALGKSVVVGESDEVGDQVVKSAGRVLRILELFDVLRREAPVSEVSELLCYPQSSTSVLLRSMVLLGYLTYNRRTRAFAPTTRVALLGSWINEYQVSDGTLLQLLRRLNERTGEAVILAVKNQISAEYIHVVQASSAARLFVRKGARRPLAASSSGLVFLADLPDAEIKRVAVRTNAEARVGEPQISITTLMSQIEEVRRLGYALTCDLVTPGGGMLAMRLPQLERGERLVVGIGGVSEVLRRRSDELVTAMREEIDNYARRDTAPAAPPERPAATSREPDLRVVASV